MHGFVHILGISLILPLLLAETLEEKHNEKKSLSTSSTSSSPLTTTPSSSSSSLIIVIIFFTTTTPTATLSSSISSISTPVSTSALPPTTKLPSDYPPMLRIGRDESSLYYVNLTLGVPQQMQHLRLDLAQPYLWVSNGDADSDCNKRGSSCSNTGFYYPNQSYTGEFWDPEYNPSYNMSFIDAVVFSGQAYNDELTFDSNVYYYNSTTANSLTIENMSFFSADYSENLIGALGLSGKTNNSDWMYSDISQYNFDDSFYFLHQMVEQGLINSSSYSLWLGGDSLTFKDISSAGVAVQNNNVGKLLLGAVDPSLFTGDLIKFKNIPFYNASHDIYSYGYPIIPLTAVNVISNTSKTVNLTDSTFLEPVLLDSRYTYNYLPLTLVTELAIQTNAYYVQELSSWYVDCSLGSIGAHVSFTFGNLHISVPLIDLMGNSFTSATGRTLYFSGGDEACLLKVRPSYRVGFSVLGGPFLKNIYMAADLEDHSVAIAQAVILDHYSVENITSTELLYENYEEELEDELLSLSSVSAASASAASKSAANAKFTTSSSHSSFTSSANTSSQSATSSTTTSNLYGISTIVSGSIPYAKTNNVTTELYLTAFSASSFTTQYGSNVLEIFGYNITYASLFSGNEIVTVTRSFYDTTIAIQTASSLSPSSTLSGVSSTKKSNNDGSSSCSDCSTLILFTNPTGHYTNSMSAPGGIINIVTQTFIYVTNSTTYDSKQTVTYVYTGSSYPSDWTGNTNAGSVGAALSKPLHSGLKLLLFTLLGIVLL
ncbi:hypothetical protein ACO0QE_000661 [Hanseniaspora vineae]